MESNQPSPTLLSQAEMEAKRALFEWIRIAFRQTFLQAAPQTWTLEPGSRIVFSASSLQACIGLVRRLSQEWQERLNEVGHEVTAGWVEEAFRRGQATLWDEPVNSIEEIDANDIRNKSEEGKGKKSDSSDQHNGGVAHSQDAAKNAVHPPTTKNVPYSALRNLGKRADLDEPFLSPRDTLNTLRQMGESGGSFWPLEGKLIDDACKAIPNRFKAETSSPNLSYQIIPRSVANKIDVATDGNMESGTTSDTSGFASPVSTVLSNRLERKRSKSGNDSLSTLNKRARLFEHSRPPSNISASTHYVNSELSQEEKISLDRLIHAGHDAPEAPHHTLFGPLEKVGTTHIRLHRDNLTEENILNDKERRRRIRARIRERLDPRRVVKNKDIQRSSSRVLRTEDRVDDSKKYFELDLGWSLMEYSSSDGKKRYCAFSSVEIVLEDHDATTNDNNRDQALESE